MSSIFCAQEPNLGYLYQIRYGLKLLLKEQNDDAVLLIETIDDISISRPDNIEVYQTKFHVNNPPNISDASTDFWKTIRVWCDLITTGQVDPDKCLFTLVTTAAASTSSILSKLSQTTIKERNVDEIITEMVAVTNTSTNQTNGPAYTAFQALSAENKKKLVKNIIVLDSAESINQAKDDIIASLRLVNKNYEPLFNRLEGWFLGQVILQLQKQRQGIPFRELQQVIWDIADTLKADNLPADFMTSIAGDEAQLSPYRDRAFVKQLNIVGANAGVINHAISDYHRAFSQASKWMREGLISPQDQIEYQVKLQDDWGRKHAAACNIIDGEEDEKTTERGRSFYQNFYVMNYPLIYIKDRFKETYMVTGSCQMLADTKKIGWHPKFETLT
jgi:hypothetical protein